MWKDNFPRESRYFETEMGILYHGDALKVLKSFPDNSIDAVCTDSPYGLKFMNQKWDYDVPSVELWKEVFRVLKPGGHLLSFFGTRTYHRGVVNIEDAGFEIRDMIQWLHSQGFPKSMDISKTIDKEFGKLNERRAIGVGNGHTGSKVKQHAGNFDDDNYEWKGKYEITAPATPEAAKWEGWGTSLKPANEPIVLARKPISEKNIAQNVMKWGTGGLNIDGTRIPLANNDPLKNGVKHDGSRLDTTGQGWGFKKVDRPPNLGRFPANAILDEEAAKMLDEQSGISKSSYSPPKARKRNNGIGLGDKKLRYGTSNAPDNYGDSGGASRFFYVAKAGRNERFFYCKTCDDVFSQKDFDKHKNHDVVFHPTVKPIKLIRYLVKLITPPNGIVLDPFFGTGTTGIAAEEEGFYWIGIEVNEEYCKIAKKRLSLIQPKLLDK